VSNQNEAAANQSDGPGQNQAHKRHSICDASRAGCLQSFGRCGEGHSPQVLAGRVHCDGPPEARERWKLARLWLDPSGRDYRRNVSVRRSLFIVSSCYRWETWG